MKPLIGITSYNRANLLAQTIEALEITTCGEEYELVIVDNASTDHSANWLNSWYDRLSPLRQGKTVLYQKTNTGCPRALNLILAYRKMGQPFVKLDNDVEIETPGWIGVVADFARRHIDAAMIGAWYDGVLGPGDCRKKGEIDDAYVVDLLPGHFVWHGGSFMDRAGYFDVLSAQHLYGFEDWIMCHKAHLLGGTVYVLKGVQMRNLQTHKAYAPIGDQDKDSHVEAMRPAFLQRLAALREGRSDPYTPPSGIPMIRGKEMK